MTTPLTLPSEGVIQLPAGAWSLEGPVTVTGRLEVRGAGAELTRIQGDAVAALLVVTGRGRLRLEALTIERTGSWGAVVEASAGRVEVVRSVVRGAANWSDLPEPRPPIPPGAEVLPGGITLRGRARAELEDVHLDDNGFAGLRVDQDARARLRGGSCSGNRTHGVEASGKASLEIDGVRIAENRAAGIGMSGGSPTVTVRGCELSANAGPGLTVSAEAVVEASECRFVGHPQNALEAYGNASVRLVGCELSDNGGAGLYAGSSCRVRLERCNVARNANNGVFACARAEVVVTGGTIDSNGIDGILAFALSCVRVERTTVRGNRRRGLEATDAATIEESDNALADNGEEPRIAWHLASWRGATPAWGEVTPAGIVAWLRAWLGKPHLPPEEVAALLAILPARVEWGLKGASPEVTRVTELAREVADEIAHAGWRPLETALWRHRDEPAVAAAIALLGLERPSFDVAWVCVAARPLPEGGIRALASDGARLFAAGPEGRIWTWDGWEARELAHVKDTPLSIEAGFGRVAVVLERRGVVVIDAASGADVARWPDFGDGCVGARPSGPGTVDVAMADRGGHPSERGTVIKRLRPGVAWWDGVVVADTQGEGIDASAFAAYGWDPALRANARRPLDGSAAVPIPIVGIHRLLAADQPPGWYVVAGTHEVAAVAPDGGVRRVEARPWDFQAGAILEEGRWFVGLEGGTRLRLHDLGSGGLAATWVGPAITAIAGLGACVAVADTTAVRWLAPWRP